MKNDDDDDDSPLFLFLSYNAALRCSLAATRYSFYHFGFFLFKPRFA